MNYSTESFPLKGCINDVRMMGDLLRGTFGIPTAVFTDDVSRADTSRAGILRRLNELAARSNVESLDLAIVHFSCHGTQARDTNGEELDGMDECLVPNDVVTAGLIRDDDIQAILTRFNRNTRVLLVLDCCHSGTMCDLRFSWEGEAFVRTENAASLVLAPVTSISGCMDPQTSADCLAVAMGKLQWAGALTSCMVQALTKDPTLVTDAFKLVSAVRTALRLRGLPQVPMLCSSHNLAKAKALCREHFQQLSGVLTSPLTAAVTDEFEQLFGYTPSARQVALILKEVEAKGVPADQLCATLADEAELYEYRGNDALALVAARDIADWALEPRNPALAQAVVASVNRYVVDQVRSKTLREVIDKVRGDLREHWGEFVRLVRQAQGGLLRVEAMDLNVRDYVRDPCDMIQCEEEQLFLRMLPLEMREIQKCRVGAACSVPSTNEKEEEAFTQAPAAGDARAAPNVPQEISGLLDQIKQASGDRGVNIFVTNPTVYLNTGAQGSVPPPPTQPTGAAAAATTATGKCDFGLGFHGLEDLLMVPKEGALAYNKCVDGASLGDLQRARDMDVLDIMCQRGNLFANADTEGAAFGQLSPDQKLALPDPAQRTCVTTSPCVPQPRVEQTALVLANKWEWFKKKREEMEASQPSPTGSVPRTDKDGFYTAETLKPLLDELGLKRLCCRRHMITHVDLIDEI
ncbi:hypothetical protein HXX76_014160 [Chlamydomonas incerta]|uniref:Peptidase C14 caspase domain-containing protein n=1 Tax=Chlamydomonas incerta TaxID=51695 RepID=A0A835SCZ1_CHLIN|nr:hypothetical protein HXX76_014160 [Chlamydomonas incerta]|eukprot:KAG2425002.1 hypothetical protein HXX76_014160 [Chlamydomonas incerta]